MPTETWITRIWREHRVGNLTRAHRDVLLTLHTYRASGGCAWPSHKTLADRAGCCVRTVQSALKAARDLGLVQWTERRVRAGWRWLRTSNLYQFLRPEAPVVQGDRPRHRTTGKICWGGEIPKKEAVTEGRKVALSSMIRDAAGVGDLLAARRAAMEARMAAG